MKLKEAKHVHFIGIGGIGMSAVARLLLEEGVLVSGSDISTSRITLDLEALGIPISYTQNEGVLPENIDAVVYTVALSDTNPEYQEAKKMEVPLFTYSEALANVTEGKEVIAISGTHGKTTTTAMVGHVLKGLGASPTVVVGSLLSETGTNYIHGNGKYVVLEACEYKRSFLALNPNHLIITNIEPDHLDYYKDIDDISNAFSELANRVPKEGFVVADTTDDQVKKILESVSATVVPYRSADVSLRSPGDHNRKNAGAVVALLTKLGFSQSDIEKELETFSGTWRRFEYKGLSLGGAKVYDDYAHHPTEISATLQGARELFPDKKIIVVFEPHLFSRTKQLFDGFVEALQGADEVYLLPIYPAREKDDGSITSSMLAKEIGVTVQQTKSIVSFPEAQECLKEKGDDCVILTLGAGTIYQLAHLLTQHTEL
ncbi:MAG: UDP-N-acetylmuramate--L-alanine ligase [Candidatus Paceibacterota bacterium]